MLPIVIQSHYESGKCKRKTSTVRQSTPTRLAPASKADSTKCRQGCGTMQALYTAFNSRNHSREKLGIVWSSSGVRIFQPSISIPFASPRNSYTRASGGVININGSSPTSTKEEWSRDLWLVCTVECITGVKMHA